MAFAPAGTGNESRIQPGDLKAAYDISIVFSVEKASLLQISDEKLIELANVEASVGSTVFDSGRFTPDMRRHIIEPARTLLGEWRQDRRHFDVMIEPKMSKIRALRMVEGQIEGERDRAARDERDTEAASETDHRYVQDKNDLGTSETRYKKYKIEHENRDANMGAFNPFYWLVLLAIGLAEWLINYDIFLLFSGVVAIAVGATLIMGVLLAFSADGHGKLFKQWSYRFGDQREAIDRHGDWRLFALSSFSLVIVLGAATGSRYAAVMHQMAGQPAMNLLGADAQVTVDPIRDVLLSLLWNVMAWAVGVFIAYMAHDRDPEFMDATRQYRRAYRRYDKRRRPLVSKLQQIKAKLKKTIEKLEASARTEYSDVAVDRSYLDQIEAHETALIGAIYRITQTNILGYHTNLVRALQSRGSILVTEPPDISPQLIRELV